MRLREYLREEEADEVLIVGEPVVSVELRPALVGLEVVIERIDRPRARRPRRQRNRRRDECNAFDTVRIPRGEYQSSLGAHREANGGGSLRLGRVEHRECVRRELRLGVRGRIGRAIRLAVTPPVERQDAEVPGEVRELELPLPRVDDRPRRQEENGSLTLAQKLPVDADPVPLDEARLVWFSSS